MNNVVVTVANYSVYNKLLKINSHFDRENNFSTSQSLLLHVYFFIFIIYNFYKYILVFGTEDRCSLEVEFS